MTAPTHQEILTRLALRRQAREAANLRLRELRTALARVCRSCGEPIVVPGARCRCEAGYAAGPRRKLQAGRARSVYLGERHEAIVEAWGRRVGAAGFSEALRALIETADPE